MNYGMVIGRVKEWREFMLYRPSVGISYIQTDIPIWILDCHSDQFQSWAVDDEDQCRGESKQSHNPINKSHITSFGLGEIDY